MASTPVTARVDVERLPEGDGNGQFEGHRIPDSVGSNPSVVDRHLTTRVERGIQRPAWSR